LGCSEILKSSASLLEFHGFIRFYEYPFSVLNPIEMDIHSTATIEVASVGSYEFSYIWSSRSSFSLLNLLLEELYRQHSIESRQLESRLMVSSSLSLCDAIALYQNFPSASQVLVKL